jgi:hypothetical protein
MPNTNRWDRLRDRIAEAARAQADAIAPSLQGGSTPPGKRKTDRNELLRRYLLLARPIETLTPEEAIEADQLWQQHFADKSRAEVAAFCLEGERIRQQVLARQGAPLSTETAAPPQPPEEVTDANLDNR